MPTLYFFVSRHPRKKVRNTVPAERNAWTNLMASMPWRSVPNTAMHKVRKMGYPGETYASGAPPQ